jgi:hypothetical protein
MRLPIVLLVGAAIAGPAIAAPPTAAIEIKDAVAQVTVIPEDRSDIRVEIVTQNRALPLKLKEMRSRTVIDGGLGGKKIRNCRGVGSDVVVRVAQVGDVGLKDMPHIVVHAPRDVDVSAGGAVFGVVGRARNVTLGAAGCGDWTVANVEQRLRINMAGAGDARAGSAGEAELRVAGSGDVATADIRGRLDVDMAGSGNVRVKSMSGPLDVHMAGSGDAVVLDGRASAMTVTMAGSGNVVFGGIAETLTARIAGSGDVRARQVNGQVRKTVVGSGSVKIGAR